MFVDAPAFAGSSSHSAAAGSQNRLYSYMSGSDGEEDQLRPSGRQAGRRRGHRGSAPGHYKNVFTSFLIKKIQCNKNNLHKRNVFDV